MKGLKMELWKPIKDYPRYSISSLGNVLKGDLKLNPSITPKGYYRIGLWEKKKVKYRVESALAKNNRGDVV